MCMCRTGHAVHDAPCERQHGVVYLYVCASAHVTGECERATHAIGGGTIETHRRRPQKWQLLLVCMQYAALYRETCAHSCAKKQWHANGSTDM